MAAIQFTFSFFRTHLGALRSQTKSPALGGALIGGSLVFLARNTAPDGLLALLIVRVEFHAVQTRHLVVRLMQVTIAHGALIARLGERSHR